MKTQINQVITEINNTKDQLTTYRKDYKLQFNMVFDKLYQMVKSSVTNHQVRVQESIDLHRLEIMPTDALHYTRPVSYLQLDKSGQYTINYNGESYQDQEASVTLMESIIKVQPELRKITYFHETELSLHNNLWSLQATLRQLVKQDIMNQLTSVEGYVPLTKLTLDTGREGEAWVKFTPTRTGKSGTMEWIKKHDDTNFVNHKKDNTTKVNDLIDQEIEYKLKMAYDGNY